MPVANFIPTDSKIEISEKIYLFMRARYTANIARNIIEISLCEDTKLSIRTSGFKAKKLFQVLLFRRNNFKYLPNKVCSSKKAH